MIKTIKSWLSNRKLWQKLLGLYLTFSIIPILALCISAFVIATNLMQKQVRVRLYDFTQSMAKQIQEKKLVYEGILDNIVYQDEFVQLLTQAPDYPRYQKELLTLCEDVLLDFQNIDSGAEDVQIILPSEIESGILVRKTNTYNQDSPLELKFPSNELLLIKSDQEHTHIYRQVINPYTGKQIGIMDITLNAKNFFGEPNIEDIKNYAVIIQNNKGINMYTDTQLGNAYGEIFPHALERSNSNEITLMRHTFLYEPYYMSDLEWNICLLIPKNSLFEGFSDVIVVSLSVAGVFIILVSAISILSFLNLSKRLNGISQEMTRVGTGKFEVSLNVKESGDEIGNLAYIFKQMVNKINTLIIDKYENELKQQEAQLKILQAQINPHFLYNCMDTINWRAIMNGDKKTSAIATNLSDFYRTCLNKGDTQIRMKNEFVNIQAYLRLQEDLHDNSFDVYYDIDERIYDYQSINLILQPIVENALEHGVEKTVGMRGFIRISAGFKTVDESLRIVINIFNTGPSIDPQIEHLVLIDPTRGYGMANVNNRIQLFFGFEYGIKIFPVENGTTCRITIPAIRWENDEK